MKEKVVGANESGESVNDILVELSELKENIHILPKQSSYRKWAKIKAKIFLKGNTVRKKIFPIVRDEFIKYLIKKGIEGGADVIINLIGIHT